MALLTAGPTHGDWTWTVRLNWPDGGTIRFGAVGFTQQVRGQVIETHSQHLSTARRREAPG